MEFCDKNRQLLVCRPPLLTPGVLQKGTRVRNVNLTDTNAVLYFFYLRMSDGVFVVSVLGQQQYGNQMFYSNGAMPQQQMYMGNPQQGMMGNQQMMMGNQQQNVMPNQQQNMMRMGNPQQGMMGNQQGMMGNQQMMMGNPQPGIMGNPQQGMMGYSQMGNFYQGNQQAFQQQQMYPQQVG